MLPHTPKISIITINYNNAVGIEETMRSVVDQEYKNIDYVIIDGASTDGSVAIIEQYAEKLGYWISEKDRGIYHAMNKGIAASKGEYLLFLNSGDQLLTKDVIATVVKNGLTADLVYGNLLFFEGKREWTWNISPKLTFETFFTSTIPHPSTFISKKLIDRVGMYDEELKIVSDWKFFMLALAKHNCSYKHINEVISAYNFDGISSKPENLKAIEAERKKVIEAEFPFFVADYERLVQQQKELKKINYFLKTRKLIKKILNQKS